MTIDRILRFKGPKSPSVGPDTSVVDAIDILGESGVEVLLVSADGSKLDGTVADRDIVRGLRKFGAAFLNKTVTEIMTTDHAHCTPEDTIADLVTRMVEGKVQYIPVIDGAEYRDVVTCVDLIKLWNEIFPNQMVDDRDEMTSVTNDGRWKRMRD